MFQSTDVEGNDCCRNPVSIPQRNKEEFSVSRGRKGNGGECNHYDNTGERYALPGAKAQHRGAMKYETLTIPLKSYLSRPTVWLRSRTVTCTKTQRQNGL